MTSIVKRVMRIVMMISGSEYCCHDNTTESVMCMILFHVCNSSIYLFPV